MTAVYIIITIIVCYILGSINNALIISKLKKSDIRECGSGNPGAMNMFRNYGFGIGLLTMVLDAVKGAAACVIGWFLVGGFSFTGTALGKYIGAISVIVGHIFPIFLKFKGGKGIASSIGICFVLSPVAAAISLAAGFVFILITKMGAVTSFIITAIPLAYDAYLLSTADFYGNLPYLIIIFAMFALTLWAHRTNLMRLFTGTENKTDLFKKLRAKFGKSKR